jgi:hypothetical protein
MDDKCRGAEASEKRHHGSGLNKLHLFLLHGFSTHDQPLASCNEQRKPDRNILFPFLCAHPETSAAI